MLKCHNPLCGQRMTGRSAGPLVPKTAARKLAVFALLQLACAGGVAGYTFLHLATHANWVTDPIYTPENVQWGVEGMKSWP